MKTEDVKAGEQISNVEPWPPLKYDDWADTAETLHLWTQIVGKIRMETTPPINHCWHVTLYVTSRGLNTSPMLNGAATFEIGLDFIDHRLWITTSGGCVREIALRPMTVARFYEQVLAALAELGVHVAINPKPCEIEEAIPFPLDTKHRSYDAGAAARFWRVLVDTSRVLSRFRPGSSARSVPSPSSGAAWTWP